jgi:hypothetical protein
MKHIIFTFLAFSILSSCFTPIFAQNEGGSSKTSTYKGKSNDQLLSTIGTTTAQGLYITYGAIGTLADAYVKGIYEKEMTITMLNEYISLTNAVNNQLKKLLTTKSLTSQEDIKFINGVMEAYRYLEGEATSFKDYIDSNSQSSANAYDENRKKAWAKICELLGIENKED